jgi:hypothetical protein
MQPTLEEHATAVRFSGRRSRMNHPNLAFSRAHEGGPMVRLMLVCTCACALLFGVAGAALASGGSDDNGGGSGSGSGGGGGGNDAVIRPLSCNSGGRGKLKLGREDGARIETEFELQHITAGRRWRLILRHNGVLIFNVVRTSSSLGRLEFRRMLTDRAGDDRVTVIAQRVPEGQRCSASGIAPAT